MKKSCRVDKLNARCKMNMTLAFIPAKFSRSDGQKGPQAFSSKRDQIPCNFRDKGHRAFHFLKKASIHCGELVLQKGKQRLKSRGEGERRFERRVHVGFFPILFFKPNLP
ncbi:hypothetical protein QPK87_03235 [Kamptonema cortianum]|nr:hypothetical protein [Kamptonema cortianum]